MEDRQRQIREGAGLEESRLNTEFIEFLKKFSTPLLLIIALAAGGYFAWNNYKVRRERVTDEAFTELDAAAESRNPVSLIRVADERGSGLVGHLARLTAADYHLDAYRTGVPIGTTPEQTGALPKDTTILTADQRAEELKKATDLYQQVVNDTESSPRDLQVSLIALHGLAACAESRGELDAAKGFYQRVIDKAKEAGIPQWADRAEKLKASVDDFKEPTKLLAEADLPASAKAIQPFTSDLQDITAKTMGGQMIKVGPGGVIENAPAPQDPAGELVPPVMPEVAPTTPPAAPVPVPPATNPAPAPADPANPK